ncbi:MAG: tRNA glutamyl-Q(34) synthetase GluQRS [Pseudomonadales bacterium]
MQNAGRNQRAPGARLNTAAEGEAIGTQVSNHYIGRFAPSPTGPLHRGSLLCALASYLDARAQNGSWLLRIEDLDPPREQPGADQLIIQSLLAHGLHWDGDILYQSSRLDDYAETIEQLNNNDQVYRCACTRAKLAELGGPYPGFCRHQSHSVNTDCAIRLTVNENDIVFEDQFQGTVSETLSNTCGDFIIRRKDGLISYQLAVSVDDAFQGITHVIRGIDLLESTSRQIHVLKQLNAVVPVYGHIPVLVDAYGDKLSKQAGAQALNNTQACENLCTALRYLGQELPPMSARSSVDDILAHAIAHYRPAAWQRKQCITDVDGSD